MVYTTFKSLFQNNFFLKNNFFSMQDKIRVKKIEFYDRDPYFNNVIVTLTTGEKFVVSGEANSYGIFIVENKRGSICPYNLQFGTVEEKEKAYDYYFKKNLVSLTDSVGVFKFISIDEKYETAIADAIIEHGKDFLSNTDTIIIFLDYHPNLSLLRKTQPEKYKYDQSYITEQKV